jgi:CxxC-x17-CxxC domain-containing protein
VYTDKVLNCKDCGREFVFTAGEQEFYAERGFQNEPGRCKECREKRKTQKNGDGASRKMYTAICADCGKECLVPFEPRGDRPVYCSECFERRKREPLTKSY